MQAARAVFADRACFGEAVVGAAAVVDGMLVGPAWAQFNADMEPGVRYHPSIASMEDPPFTS